MVHQKRRWQQRRFFCVSETNSRRAGGEATSRFGFWHDRSRPENQAKSKKMLFPQ